MPAEAAELPGPATPSQQVQELEKCASHLVLKRLRQWAQVPPEQLVVRRQNLLHQNVVVLGVWDRAPFRLGYAWPWSLGGLGPPHSPSALPVRAEHSGTSQRWHTIEDDDGAQAHATLASIHLSGRATSTRTEEGQHHA